MTTQLVKFNAGQIESLKRLAKKKKKEVEGLTHCQALDQIAVANGYENWKHLVRTTEASGSDES